MMTNGTYVCTDICMRMCMCMCVITYPHVKHVMGMRKICLKNSPHYVYTCIFDHD